MRETAAERVQRRAKVEMLLDVSRGVYDRYLAGQLTYAEYRAYALQNCAARQALEVPTKSRRKPRDEDVYA